MRLSRGSLLLRCSQRNWPKWFAGHPCPEAVPVAHPGSGDRRAPTTSAHRKGEITKVARRLLCIVTVFILLYIVACLSIFYNENVFLQRERKYSVFKKVLEIQKLKS